MKTRTIIKIVVMGVFIPIQVLSQFVEDALRYANYNNYLTPRAGALNIAYNGVADDFSALLFNPAGIALISKNELSFGFGFLMNSTESSYLYNTNKFNSNDAYLNHIGFVAPFEINNKNAAFALGYFRESIFDNNLKYSAFNNSSTYINYRAMNDGIDTLENMALYLYLAGIDSNNTIISPIKDSLMQSSFIEEGGGIHNLSGGLGFNLTDNFSVGITLSAKWGNFKYNRLYEERDDYNIYNVYESNYSNVDFNKLILNEKIEQSFSAYTAAIGLQGRIEEFMRIGATIKFPTFYSIEENFSQKANAIFDNNDEYEYINEGYNSYDLWTPFVFSAGASINILGATLAAGIEYCDVTQLEFTNALDEVENLNLIITQSLSSQITFGIGAEYEIPGMPLVVRGSFASRNSPYLNDNTPFNMLSFGAGIYLAPNIRLDGLFQWSDSKFIRNNYGSFNYSYRMKPMNMGLQLTYRFDD